MAGMAGDGIQGAAGAAIMAGGQVITAITDGGSLTMAGGDGIVAGTEAGGGIAGGIGGGIEDGAMAGIEEGGAMAGTGAKIIVCLRHRSSKREI